ncbi:MAG: glycosyl hydrolase 108 family protein [Patescibacteria group bacterium]|jgi:lysozyme family protein
MKDYFPQIFDYLLNIEGLYSDDPDDPGSETKYGISKASFPDEDIANLTKARAEYLYRKNYWERYRCNLIQSPLLAAEVFVAVVNVNGAKVIKYLQTACNNLGAGLKVDGLIGPATLDFINNFRHSKAIVAAFEGEMYKHYCNQGKKKYISGWLIRNDGDFEV